MKRIFLTGFVFIAMLFVSCSTSTRDGNIKVEDVWARSSPSAAQNGAIYMVITNNTNQDDQLLGIMTDACAVTELHEMQIDENDVMTMRQVPGGAIDLPAGESVELKVGGLHVMCIDKQISFEAGATFPITLDFANAQNMDLTVEVRDSVEGGMSMGE